ncbi:MAG: hypothetical protein LBH25_15395 [Fibromonadaceae bacterium]|nr:hypothetical protein [Fibromonadaceae bacterium]
MKKSLILLAAVFAAVFSLSACSEVKSALTEECVYSRNVADITTVDIDCQTVPINTCEKSASALGLGVKGTVTKSSCDEFDFSDANVEYCKFQESNTSTELTCEKVPKGKCEDLPTGTKAESCSSSSSSSAD